VQRSLIFLGVAILVVGLLWPWLSKLPLGRLPGDLVIDRPGVKVIFPITTMLVVSALLSLVAWLMRR
jgi:hypothetical protein